MCRSEKVDQVHSTLSATHFFPVAVETLAPLLDETHSLRAEIGRSAGNYVPVKTYFRGNSAFQRSLSCQHVHSFRVPIVTIPHIHFCICYFQDPVNEVPGQNNNNNHHYRHHHEIVQRCTRSYRNAYTVPRIVPILKVDPSMLADSQQRTV